jgi:hypothetical protein
LLPVNILLPSFTSLLALSFAVVLLTRFVKRKQTYYLVWTLGLLWYAVAAGSEALGAIQGWTAPLYKLWYATGAIGVAAYLGAGTIYLHKDQPFGSLTVVCFLIGSIPALAGRHVAIGLIGLASATVLTMVLSLKPKWFPHAVFTILLVTSLLASLQIAQTQVDITQLPAPQDVVTGQAFNQETRALTPPFNIAGAAVLILGAVISALSFWRTRALPTRVASNVLIAIGAFIPSLSSGLTRFGITSLFFAGELLGLLFILAGFLLSGSPTPPPSSDPTASAGPS